MLVRSDTLEMTAMSHDTLTHSIETTHDVLATRLETAEASHPTLERPRDRFPATDTFLASASRHVAAANAVLVPAARQHLPNGVELAHEFTRQSRHLEAAMALVKAKLYGSSQAIRLPWRGIWADLHLQFDLLLELEESIVRDLVERTDQIFRDDLANRVYRAELRSPTRPHPYVPHLGMTGRMARRLCLQVDHFWDTTEGRMIPEPIKPHDRAHDGPITQYFLGDPHFEEE
ncbi:MAG: hypothetical protein L0H93_16425 [Nocardioides sp.]|nr:hypothetical protein [Nocardioides sp.]